MTAERVAALIASRANQCCYRSDGWEEDLARWTQEILILWDKVRGVDSPFERMVLEKMAIEEQHIRDGMIDHILLPDDATPASKTP